MIITFHSTGAVEFTRKPELLKLFDGEHKSVSRMTEILFDEARQKFYIRWLKGPAQGDLHAGIVEDKVMACVDCGEHAAVNPFATIFDTYEEAVAEELRAVDACRLNGFSFR